MGRTRKQLAETNDRFEDQLDEVALQVKEAYLDFCQAAERIPVAEKSIELAEENLRISQDQYVEGLLTSADVLTEEERLARARSSYYRALYESHRSLARLTYVAGGSLPDKEGSQVNGCTLP